MIIFGGGIFQFSAHLGNLAVVSVFLRFSLCDWVPQSEVQLKIGLSTDNILFIRLIIIYFQPIWKLRPYGISGFLVDTGRSYRYTFKFQLLKKKKKKCHPITKVICFHHLILSIFWSIPGFLRNPAVLALLMISQKNVKSYARRSPGTIKWWEDFKSWFVNMNLVFKPKISKFHRECTEIGVHW